MQASGCQDEAAVWMANCAAYYIILQARPHFTGPVLHGGNPFYAAEAAFYRAAPGGTEQKPPVHERIGRAIGGSCCRSGGLGVTMGAVYFDDTPQATERVPSFQSSLCRTDCHPVDLSLFRRPTRPTFRVALRSRAKYKWQACPYSRVPLLHFAAGFSVIQGT